MKIKSRKNLDSEKAAARAAIEPPDVAAIRLEKYIAAVCYAATGAAPPLLAAEAEWRGLSVGELANLVILKRHQSADTQAEIDRQRRQARIDVALDWFAIRAELPKKEEQP